MSDGYKEIGGAYPQISSLYTKLPQPDNFMAFINTDIDGALPLDTGIPNFKLSNNSKITDNLSCIHVSGSGLIINNRLYDLFNNLEIGQHQYFDANVYHKEKFLTNYKLIYFARDQSYIHDINWEKSEFTVTKSWITNDRLQALSFDSWSDLRNKDQKLMEENMHIVGDLKLNQIPKYDLFNYRFPYFPMGFICNQKVKNAIEENKITGFSFEPVDMSIYI